MKNLKVLSVACVLMLTTIVSTAFAGRSVSVPEIDGSLAGGAVALLIGGYLVVASKWRRK
jgi:hypothetical protein